MYVTHPHWNDSQPALNGKNRQKHPQPRYQGLSFFCPPGETVGTRFKCPTPSPFTKGQEVSDYCGHDQTTGTIFVVLLAKEGQNQRGLSEGPRCQKRPRAWEPARHKMAAHKEDLVSTLESSLQVIKRLGSLPELICYICVFKVRNRFSRRRVYLCYLSLIMWRKMARKPMSTKAVSS